MYIPFLIFTKTIIKLEYVRLSRNLYVHYVRLSRNLYIHYVRLSRDLHIHYVRLRPTLKKFLKNPVFFGGGVPYYVDDKLCWELGLLTRW